MQEHNLFVCHFTDMILNPKQPNTKSAGHHIPIHLKTLVYHPCIHIFLSITIPALQPSCMRDPSHLVKSESVPYPDCDMVNPSKYPTSEQAPEHSPRAHSKEKFCMTGRTDRTQGLLRPWFCRQKNMSNTLTLHWPRYSHIRG